MNEWFHEPDHTVPDLQSWALLLGGGPDPARGVLVIVEGSAAEPPSVHHVGASASVRSLAESGWSPTGPWVRCPWGLAVPVQPGASGPSRHS